MKILSLLLVLLGLAISVFAEYRIWTDRKGNTLEAEFAGTEGKKIVLQKQDGSTVIISPLSLSDDDKEYLHGKVSAALFDPTVDGLDLKKPRLEIQFRKVTDTDNSLGNPCFRDIHMVGLVNIIRKSGTPYSGHLNASVYIIGHNQTVNGYVMLDSTTHDLDLENNTEISISGTNLIIHEEKGRSSNHTQYAGYVVVITDEEGCVVAMKSSSPEFEENYKKFKKFKTGTVFDRNFWKQKTRVRDVRYE